MLKKFSLAIVASSLISYGAASQGLVPDQQEFDALKALYDSLAGPGWTTKTSWPTAGSWPASATATQMDAWYGVVVTNGDITELNLPTNNMTGKLPQAIGNLTALTRLYFHNNKINSALPAQLNNLVNLTYLDMGYNQITGLLPNLPGLTKLQTLIFRNNSNLAAAPMPSWVPWLATLKHVNFSMPPLR
ncbi:MAG: leucine-rich repeat domain-containing protein [Bacteroidota bacterium]